MFTSADRLFAWSVTAGLLCGVAANAQESPLPRPPLQPKPKEFKVPRPKLGVPDGIPVAQESAPHRSFQTDPLPPEKRFDTTPDPKRETPRTLPERGAAIGAQASKEAEGTRAETRVVGKIFRVDKDRVVVRTHNGGELVLYLDPQTNYLRRDAAAAHALMVPGASITAVYARRGDRFWITALDLRTDETPPLRPTALAPAAAGAYESEIVRVMGPDQIVVRNPAGIEFPVYVTGDTRYLVGDTSAAFGDLRPGMRIRVEDELRAERHFARRIVGMRR
jgi:hypothetical protein